jgi:hypothetical protein
MRQGTLNEYKAEDQPKPGVLFFILYQQVAGRK